MYEGQLYNQLPQCNSHTQVMNDYSNSTMETRHNNPTLDTELFSFFEDFINNNNTESNPALETDLFTFFKDFINSAPSDTPQNLQPIPQTTPSSPPALGPSALGPASLPPNILQNGPVTLNNLNLQLNNQGMLSEQSKTEVNALLSELTDQIGGNEVHGAVFRNNQGGLSLQITPGEQSSVSYIVPNNTIYSAHTHPRGTLSPSATDLRNQLPEAEDAFIVDGRGYTYA